MATVNVRSEIEHQKRQDKGYEINQGLIDARIYAFREAQLAISRREIGGIESLRQCCIDLAAAAELVASELPKPARNGLGANGMVR